MARSQYFGENPITTTVQASPAPTTTVFTVGSAVDFVDGQYILVEISGDLERVKLDSITGAQFTLAEPLSAPPTAGASVKSGRTLLRNTLFNDSSIYHADAISDVKAIVTTDAPENLRYQVPGLGVLRLDKASTATADDLFIYAPDSGPGRWILEVGKQNDRWGKLTTATERTVQTFGGTEYVCKATVDASNVSAGNVSIYADSALVATIAAGNKEYHMFDADTDVEVSAEDIFFDIDDATYSGLSIGVSSKEAIFMRSTEDKFFVISALERFIRTYTCTAGDISTAVLVNAELFDTGEFSRGLFFSPDGTKMYICRNDEIHQFTLGTAWNASTAGSKVTYTASSFTDAHGIFISPDGLHLFVIEDSTTNRVYQLDFGTAWDVSTLSDVTDVSVNSQTSGSAFGIMLNSDGTKLYVLGNATSQIFQYTLSTAWALSTIDYDSLSLDVTAQDNNMRGLCMVNYLRFYAVGDQNDDAYQYTIGSEFTGTARYQLEYGVAA